MASAGLYELSLVATIGNVVMMLDTTHIIMITTGVQIIQTNNTI